jgi:hypothetical protein
MEGVVKSRLAPPGAASPKAPSVGENVLECSFTTSKLRFSALASATPDRCFALPPVRRTDGAPPAVSMQWCAHFGLARKHNPTFYETLNAN